MSDLARFIRGLPDRIPDPEINMNANDETSVEWITEDKSRLSFILTEGNVDYACRIPIPFNNRYGNILTDGRKDEAVKRLISIVNEFFEEIKEKGVGPQPEYYKNTEDNQNPPKKN